MLPQVLFSQTISFGQAGSFSVIPSGLSSVIISDNFGATLGELVLELEDGAEGSLLVTGSRALGFSFMPLFQDLD